MRFSETLYVVGVLIAGAIMTACGGDPDKPATLDQQRAAMHHAPPSADDLKQAMSKVHFKTPGSGSGQAPPGGMMPPPGTKVGK